MPALSPQVPCPVNPDSPQAEAGSRTAPAAPAPRDEPAAAPAGAQAQPGSVVERIFNGSLIGETFQQASQLALSPLVPSLMSLPNRPMGSAYREAISTIMSGMGSADLSQLLGSESYFVRESATAMLTSRGMAAHSALSGALTSQDPEVRLRAQAVMASIYTNHAQGIATQLLGTPEQHAQAQALLAQYRIQAPGGPNFERLMTEVRYQMADALTASLSSGEAAREQAARRFLDRHVGGTLGFQLGSISAMSRLGQADPQFNQLLQSTIKNYLPMLTSQNPADVQRAQTALADIARHNGTAIIESIHATLGADHPLNKPLSEIIRGASFTGRNAPAGGVPPR